MAAAVYPARQGLPFDPTVAAPPTGPGHEAGANPHDNRSTEPGTLGISLQALDEELAGVLGVSNGKGMLVTAIELNSAAAAAGLRPGDILASVAGEPTQNLRDFAAALDRAKPGSVLALGVVRSGRPTELQVTVRGPSTERPAEDSHALARTAVLGLSLAPRRDDPPAREGAVVERVDPGSVAEHQGLRTGDVILQVDGRAVTAPRDVVEAVDAAREAGRPGIAVQIEREDNRVSAALLLRPKG